MVELLLILLFMEMKIRVEYYKTCFSLHYNEIIYIRMQQYLHKQYTYDF